MHRSNKKYDIPERDCKILQGMKDELLQLACGDILDRISTLIIESHESNHKTYLKLWETMRKEDRMIVGMFDDLKRSTAILKLLAWYNYGYIGKETLKQFSIETQNHVALICRQ